MSLRFVLPALDARERKSESGSDSRLPVVTDDVEGRCVGPEKSTSWKFDSSSFPSFVAPLATECDCTLDELDGLSRPLALDALLTSLRV